MVWLNIILFTLFCTQLFAQELNSQEKSYFNFLDLNNDNYISYDEIDNSIRIVFQLIDKDKDMKISFEELEDLKSIIESFQ